MKRVTFLLVFSITAFACFSQVKTKNFSLKLTNTITLSNIKGGFDLMTVDTKGKRLFAAAEDNNSVEVIDLKSFSPITSLPGFQKPHWIVYRPESNRLYVATSLDRKVTVLNGQTYQIIKTFNFKEGCNNLRFDSKKDLLYIGIGVNKGFGSIVIIDVRKDKILGEITLSDYPKQFDIVGNKMYINIPENNTIEIADLTKNKVIAKWIVSESQKNVPMGVDRIHQRLFVGCEPGKLIVYNLKTGKAITSIDINKSSDGIYYDSKRSLIYVSCGEGFINVINQVTPDSYELISKIPTVEGAGTSLYVPELDLYVLAVPQYGNNKPEIRLYKPSMND